MVQQYINIKFDIYHTQVRRNPYVILRYYAEDITILLRHLA